MEQFTEPCPNPKCKKETKGWFERAEFASRAIWWHGCQVCGYFAGGLSEIIAIHNWNREAYRLKRKFIYDSAVKSVR